MIEKSPLSKQEVRVLNELANGSLYKEIAIELSISINTVKKHLKNIYKKLEVKNRKHAAVTVTEKRNAESAAVLSLDNAEKFDISA